ncbi:MAG: hypothetical protein Q4E53_10450 [Eubacteriales bacterium]|nr:hypothetical protein [Eubacteriales bacterium]
MKLELVGYRVNKCNYENNIGPNMKVNLPITTNSQIKVPKEFKKGSIGTVLTKFMVGNPMHPLYLYLEVVTSYADVEATEETCESAETMMSLFKTICVPLANEQIEKILKEVCHIYNIPEIKLQKNSSQNTGNMNLRS